MIYTDFSVENYRGIRRCRLEKLERELKGGMRVCSAQTYADELKREAMKIIDQIKI